MDNAMRLFAGEKVKRERRDSNPRPRRDRPALALAGGAGIGGDYRCEQGLPT
jgi:hypothetical protein